MKRPQSPSLRGGVAWSLGALVFLALAGIGLNIIIARLYTPQILGTFSLVFSLYVILSHVSVFGLQNATLQAVSVNAERAGDTLSEVIGSALTGVLIVNLCAMPVFLALAWPIGHVFQTTPNIAMSWLLTAPGLLFFSLNKVLLAALNGVRLMRSHALFLSARFGLILIVLLGYIAAGVPGWALPSVLAIAELLLFIPLALHGLGHGLVRMRKLAASRTALYDRLRFGALSMPAGALAGLNGRTDVLMIGALLDTRAVGIYTIAALAYDAGVQIVVAIRTNINPLIAQAVTQDKSDTVAQMSRRMMLGLAGLFTVALLAGALLFPLLVPFLLKEASYADAYIPMMILLGALTMGAGGICFNMTLSQAGAPGVQSVLIVGVVLLNLAANALLIPVFGIAGAAMGTAIALVCAALINRFLVWKWIGIRLFF